MQPSVPEPVFLNLEYLFFLVLRTIGNFFSNIFSIEFLESLRIFATILVILLIAAIFYLMVRLYELQQEEKQHKPVPVQSTAPEPGGGQVTATGPTQPLRNEIWEAIRAKLLSDSPSDWRLAIIEADIYLDRVLDNRGFHGETIGDKFKQLTPADLPSIQIAWEAHKVRNRIAHEGAQFTLTQPEARRVLSYYEIIFRDLGVIV